MAYIEKLAKLIDLINADTFEDGMTTGNDGVYKSCFRFIYCKQNIDL